MVHVAVVEAVARVVVVTVVMVVMVVVVVAMVGVVVITGVVVEVVVIITWPPKRPGPASDRDNVTMQTLRAGIRAPPPEKPYVTHRGMGIQ